MAVRYQQALQVSLRDRLRRLLAADSRGSSLAKAASTARSAQSGFGRTTCRRSTATSCRSTSISASFAASLRARSTSQPNTRAMNT